MSESTQPTSKEELLATIQTAYNQFATLLASLSEEQMTTPGVNGSWSVKDNLAHLTAWQNYQASRQEATLKGEPEPARQAMQGESEDEINEYIYQQHKDQPLAEGLADFRAAYQRIFASTQALSWEALDKPFPWYDNDTPVGAYTLGNTSAHYEEHGGFIQSWLEAQKV